LTEAGLIILGVIAGILSGLFGVGGGIVMVPTLILLFGMEILDANATSLAAMLLPVGVLGVIAYYKARLINIADSLWISLGLFMGSFAGGEIAVNINNKLLALLYSAILIYVSVSYLNIPALFRKKAEKQDVGIEQGEPLMLKRPYWAFILTGLAAGVFAGLFGKGGGLIIVPMLIGFFRYHPKAAAATSLAALQLPVGLPSVLVYAQAGHLNIMNAALIAGGIVVGTQVGSVISVKMSSALFKKLYALFLFSVAIYMVIKNL